MTAIVAMWARLLTLPRWAKVAIAIALLAALAGIWLSRHDRAVVQADRHAAAAKVAPTVRAADANAQAQIDVVSNQVEKENADARKAAAGGSDLLGDGLRSLRQAKASDRPAASKPH